MMRWSSRQSTREQKQAQAYADEIRSRHVGDGGPIDVDPAKARRSLPHRINAIIIVVVVVVVAGSGVCGRGSDPGVGPCTPVWGSVAVTQISGRVQRLLRIASPVQPPRAFQVTCKVRIGIKKDEAFSSLSFCPCSHHDGLKKRTKGGHADHERRRVKGGRRFATHRHQLYRCAKRVGLAVAVAKRPGRGKRRGKVGEQTR